MLWKCCIHYASKFGKLSSSHRTGKGQFSFQSQEGNAKECSNYRTTALISHANKVMLKILQDRLQHYVNWELPVYKLDSEKAEEAEIKLPIYSGAKKKQGNPQNIYFCFTDYTKGFASMDYNQLWNIFKEMGISDHLTCLLRNQYARREATLRAGHGTTDWFQVGKGVHQGCILLPCLFNI